MVLAMKRVVVIVVVLVLLLVAAGCSTHELGPIEMPLVLDARGAEMLALEVADVASTGQVVRVRGHIRNLHGEEVRGVMYRVRFLSRKSSAARVLQTELVSRRGLRIEPGERKFVTFEVESMYVNLKAGANFQVDAWPMKIGDRTVEPPADW